MPVRTVHHVSLVVQDLEEALHFYRDSIGQPQIPRLPGITSPGAWLQLGDKQLHLIVAQGPHAASQQHVALEMDSVQDPARQLSAAGVTIERGPARRSDGSWFMFVRDPSGNLLELVSREAPSAS